MEDSDSKRNESMSFAHNEEIKLIKDLQALMSCSIPTDLLLSILQSQMLSNSGNNTHQSISHLLLSYSGKRGTIANITILPLDIAQIIRYLFGCTVAVINCTQYTNLKDLVTKMSVHSNVNYKEWSKQLKNKQIANKNSHKSNKESDEKQKEIDDDINDDNNINSQILILGSSDTQNSNHRHHKHEASVESHSSLFTEPKLLSKDNENKPALKRFLSEPNLSQSIHNLHVQKLKEFELPSSSNNKNKQKLDVISCQVVIFHNAHKLSKAMQSMIVQIMKMKQVPTSEHGIHQRISAQNQLCIITRQTNKNLPFLMRDLCCFHYCIPSKKSLKKLHKFVKYEMSETDPSSSFDEPYLFGIQRLNALYNAVAKVFIHNSMAQYIRDIIVAIRLHPDVKNGCSSFRSNEAMLIGSKFTNFISRLNERCNGLKRINSACIHLLIERIHFVRPKDVDNMAMQISSHRIDIIANEYSPSLSYERQEYEDENERNVKKEKAETLKQLRLDIMKGTKQRGSTYRTGSMSLPRTPREDKERIIQKKVIIKEEEQRNENDEIDIDDFEYELFSDSDDYDFVDEDDEFYDDEEDEYGDDGHGYDDDNNEYAAEEYDEYLDGDHNMESNLDYHTNQSSKRNSDNVTGYSLLSEVNEKRLSAEQRLVDTLLRKVLLPPK